jgi:hypothetical protein
MSDRMVRNAEKKPARKKLRLSKETLKDLADDKRNAGQVKGAGGGRSAKDCGTVG